MRLSKVAKELNVGIANIVDHLASKGVKVDGRPNTKITQDAYEILKQQFIADVEQHKRSTEVAQARREEKQAIKDAATKKLEKTADIVKAKANVSGPKMVGKIEVSPTSKTASQEKSVKSTAEFSDTKTKSQKEIARKALTTKFEAMVDVEETAMPPSESDKSRRITGKASGRIVTSLATMQAGKTLEERVLSASDIAGRDDTIIKIVETPDEILVTRQSSTKGAQPVTTPYPRGEATLSFVKGAASGLTGVEDINTALKNSSLTEGMVAAPITETAVLFERTTPPKPPSGLVKFDTQLANDFNPNILSEITYEDSSIMGELTPIATKYGVRISNPSKVTESLTFEIGEGNQMVSQTVELGETTKEGILNALKGFIKSFKY